MSSKAFVDGSQLNKWNLQRAHNTVERPKFRKNFSNDEQASTSRRDSSEDGNNADSGDEHSFDFSHFMDFASVEIEDEHDAEDSEKPNENDTQENVHENPLEEPRKATPSPEYKLLDYQPEDISEEPVEIIDDEPPEEYSQASEESITTLPEESFICLPASK